MLLFLIIKKKSFFKNLSFPKFDVNFIIYKKIDLSKCEKIRSTIYDLINTYKKIDILINCAGIQHTDPIENFPDKKWQQIIDINISSSFYTTKYILPIMKKNNYGRIINIASVHGLVASLNKSAYVASKHAMIGLTKSIALETANLPITSNAICPGFVDTPLIAQQFNSSIKKNNTSKKNEIKKFLKDKQPSLKFISSNSISSLAYYLSTDDASEITGSSINIDGGWLAQ